ncbi:sugar ABC transporter [Planctomycetaceae bacterium SCGC AG-212-F19]|nr:sugar ABC transporter [Planctomycetaceae bacterium SCGC AG-212-F19]
MAWIDLDSVHLTFPLHMAGRGSIKDRLVHPFKRSPEAAPRTVHALRNVSLRVDDGERVGVIGHNGAGKSTLLKLLAGVYPPTSGQRRVQGRISALFELTLGFQPDSTGWENISFRGYLQGETPRSIRRLAEGIAEFSELGRFLDLPIRCYSSGMLVRLAFAIATAIEPEVLLLDEVISAGDLAFQMKARQRMEEMMAKARLMVIVSHDLESIGRLCTRAVWLQQGSVAAMGSARDVIANYRAAAGARPAAA